MSSAITPPTIFVNPSDVRGVSYSELKRSAMGDQSSSDPILIPRMEMCICERLKEGVWVNGDALPTKLSGVKMVGIRLSNRVLLQVGLKSLHHLFVVRDFNMLCCLPELADAMCLPMYSDVYQME